MDARLRGQDTGDLLGLPQEHNQTVGKLTEHTFRFATRQAMKKGCNRFVVRAARKEDAI